MNALGGGHRLREDTSYHRKGREDERTNGREGERERGREGERERETERDGGGSIQERDRTGTERDGRTRLGVRMLSHTANVRVHKMERDAEGGEGSGGERRIG